MGDEHDDTIEDLPGGEETADEAAAAAGDAITAALSQVPESVRNSPEFKALEKEHRKTVRKLGTATRAASAAREEAERVRLAAEAERQAALESQLNDELGEDGIAAFNELAELSTTDPVAAARRFKELMATAQSGASSEPPAADPPTDPEAPVTTPSNAVPPPPGAVDGSAPLQPPNDADDLEALTGPLDQRWATTVERNLTPATRNRVTMRERADALIGFLASSYLKTPEVAARLRLRR